MNDRHQKNETPADNGGVGGGEEANQEATPKAKLVECPIHTVCICSCWELRSPIDTSRRSHNCCICISGSWAISNLTIPFKMPSASSSKPSHVSSETPLLWPTAALYSSPSILPSKGPSESPIEGPSHASSSTIVKRRKNIHFSPSKFPSTHASVCPLVEPSHVSSEEMSSSPSILPSVRPSKSPLAKS